MNQGAESADDAKTRMDRRLKFYRDSNSIRTRLSRWWWENTLSIRLEYLMWKLEADRKALVKCHCSKGFHNLYKQAFEAHYKKSVWRVEYLMCHVCGWKFFATGKDKRKYLRMTSHKRKNKWKGFWT